MHHIFFKTTSHARWPEYIFWGCFAIITAICVSCSNGSTENTGLRAQTAQVEKKDVGDAGQKYVLEALDNSAGLSNSSVNCIFQDSQNLLWVGTWDGLNRYDGSSFKIFRPEPNNKNSLSNQVVLKVTEDSLGHIWVLTMHGINRYEKATDKFYHYFFSTDTTAPLSESQFNLAIDGNKQVFCAVKDWGIGYFDGKGFQRMDCPALKDESIRRFGFSGNTMLALTETNRLFALNVSLADRKVLATEIIEGVRTFDILPDKKIVMVNVAGMAYLLQAGLKKKLPIAHNVENITAITTNDIILFGKTGHSALNHSGKAAERPYTHFLSRYKVTSVIKGTENIIWIGTDGDGILKASPQERLFKNISKTQIPELDGAIVRSFVKGNDNSLWVGTKGNGLFHITSGLHGEPGILKYNIFNEANSPVDNAVYSLCKGQDDLIFIGTDEAGISVYDSRAARVISWKDIGGSGSVDYFKSVYAIYQDKQKNTWLGTNGYGMIRLNIVRNGNKLQITSHKKYTAKTGSHNALNSNIIFSIVPKGQDQLWVGTRLGGLNLFTTGTEIFHSYKNKPGDASSLSNNDILCLNLDNRGRLWIGTSYGLNLLESLDNNGKAVFRHYTVEDGLPNNTIHGIIPYNESGIWVSTNFGLSDFNVSEKKFTNYIKGDGLQNNEFADGAFYRDAETGHVFMGGIKGFNYFLPQGIKESAAIPDLFIDRISGHNQTVPFFQGLLVSPKSDSAPALTLKHNQNFFDIHLTALAFTNNEKCRYAYQLKGFDKSWNTIGNRKIISFTNVPPGNYSLYMKWSNSDGVWTAPVHTADIGIKPVWWQSSMALVIYTILGVGFILFVRSYYLKRQSLMQNILFRQREEELHENRLTFFTNIAHEFLTPLTLIAGPVQKLFEAENLDDRSRKFIKMIQRNASRLSFLTQQLLEFRKAEDDHLEVRVRQFDMVGILEQIAELFDDWAIDKHINYQLQIPNSLEGWFDKEKVEKIVFNLLSNAFKYTPADGQISFSSEIEYGKGEMLRITIVNSGKGIPKEKLESLFDRFFLSDPNQVSDTEMFRTGIGLAYVKRLVTVMRGEIQVSSIPDEATTFTILIPCDKSAFTEREIDNSGTSGIISGHLKDILEEPDTAIHYENTPEKVFAIEKAQDGRRKILVVEDEKEIHMYLKDLLGEKYNVAFALNGADAMQMVDKELPDLIISDVMMPVMDGVALCRIIKTDLRTCHIPFIMLTAKSSVEHRIEGLESGANSYIPKPFYPDHLLVRVQKLLEEKELILKHFAQDTLVDNLHEMPLDKDGKVFIREAIEVIHKNIDSENLDSAFIEKSMGISNSQLYRKTKEYFSLSPGDLIRTVRLKHAAELLRKNVLTVSEVCYKSGFNNRSYFYREFKKLYGTTPKNYQLQFTAKKGAFK
ncbi:two-component regulator propeller domain-containing protein [uncultured Flavobacterium sp.]|uniref:two-component regulator propeller domain-containing protein n=1 Tax=uncultured Flavobacterium sp. TaxID=165435 RepID=UPI0025E3471D|nr:two-component regulator propeller domain-containing protein [uncultured Flavobacterium sp.]